ncbi:MAG TPA: nucleotidyltransferase family protein [Polyangiaceae bacterium]|nr:nucleotidyltransferase family protein [Polyangiaceae bacterium]
MTTRLSVSEQSLADFCRQHGVRRRSLFGSELKGTARSDSDIDLLVEFQPDARPTLLTMAAMEEELSSLLGARRVDLRTPAELSRYFRDEVLREAEVQYVAA